MSIDTVFSESDSSNHFSIIVTLSLYGSNVHLSASIHSLSHSTRYTCFSFSITCKAKNPSAAPPSIKISALSKSNLSML